jgi:hypothetical protein
MSRLTTKQRRAAARRHKAYRRAADRAWFRSVVEPNVSYDVEDRRYLLSRLAVLQLGLDEQRLARVGFTPCLDLDAFEWLSTTGHIMRAYQTRLVDTIYGGNVFLKMVAGLTAGA